MSILPDDFFDDLDDNSDDNNDPDILDLDDQNNELLSLTQLLDDELFDELDWNQSVIWVADDTIQFAHKIQSLTDELPDVDKNNTNTTNQDGSPKTFRDRLNSLLHRRNKTPRTTGDKIPQDNKLDLLDDHQNQRAERNTTFPIFVGGIEMGDKNTINAGAGSINQAGRSNRNIGSIYNQLDDKLNLSDLANELSILRKAMRDESEEAEHDIAVGEIGKAEQAATSGDRTKVLEHLKAAGEWALDVATRIGTMVASDALKKSLGVS